MKGISLENAEIGTVSSRVDGSVAFRVITGELRPSEAGAVLAFHGKACKVTVMPHEGAPEEVVTVDSEIARKTPGQRLRAVIFLAWKNKGESGRFEDYYAVKMEAFIERVKRELP